MFADVADVIERRFESHIINLRPNHARYRSLTDTQLQIIRTLIRLGGTDNPFPERLQLRNWLMIELLLETGIRRGELLKLYTTDINKGSQHAYTRATTPKRYAATATNIECNPSSRCALTKTV